MWLEGVKQGLEGVESLLAERAEPPLTCFVGDCAGAATGARTATAAGAGTGADTTGADTAGTGAGAAAAGSPVTIMGPASAVPAALPVAIKSGMTWFRF